MASTDHDGPFFDDHNLTPEEGERLLCRIEAGERIPFSVRCADEMSGRAEVLARGFAEMATTLGYDVDDEPTVEVPAR